MSKRTSHKFQDGIQARILREHPDAPPTVVLAEARYRVGQHARKLRKLGGSLKAVGSAVGYSPTYLQSVVLPVAEQRAALGSEFVPPLDAWLATDAAHTPAPKPEDAIDPERIKHEVWKVYDTHDLSDGMHVTVYKPAHTPEPRVWHLIQDGNGLTLVDPPTPAVPEPYVPTDADRALYALVQDRAPLLGAAVRLLQLAAGIPATGDVDDATMSVVAGLTAWQGRPRPLLDAVETFMAGRRRA